MSEHCFLMYEDIIKIRLNTSFDMFINKNAEKLYTLILHDYAFF